MYFCKLCLTGLSLSVGIRVPNILAELFAFAFEWDFTFH